MGSSLEKEPTFYSIPDHFILVVTGGALTIIILRDVEKHALPAMSSLYGTQREACKGVWVVGRPIPTVGQWPFVPQQPCAQPFSFLLYPSDAADEAAS